MMHYTRSAGCFSWLLGMNAVAYQDSFSMCDTLYILQAASRGSLGSIGRSPVTREVGLDPQIYKLFAFSGGLGCSLTHLAVVPLDVVKTRLQTRPGRCVRALALPCMRAHNSRALTTLACTGAKALACMRA